MFSGNDDNVNSHQVYEKCTLEKENSRPAAIPDKKTNDFILQNVKNKVCLLGIVYSCRGLSPILSSKY